MTGRDRRAIGVGVGVVLAAFVGLRWVPAQLVELDRQREEVAALQALVERQLMKWAGSDSLETVLEHRQIRFDSLQTLVVDAEQEGDGAQWLADRAQEVLAAAEARFVRIEQIVSGGQDAVGVAAIALEFAGTEGSLRSVLATLERVDRIVVRSLEVDMRDDLDDPLWARVVLEAYFLRGGGVS